MNILAIDASAKSASVAIFSNEILIADFFMNTKITHSQTLMPMISNALNFVSLSPSDIDGFAISNGPGSFTGLRIGIAAIKGLSYATNKPCVAISTLHAIAQNLIGFDGIICAVMDARCNQVYTATFCGENNQINRLCDDNAISIDDLYEQLKSYKKNIFLVGDGADLCYNKFSGKLNCFLCDSTKRFQRASSVGAIAIKEFENGNTISAENLCPSYLRLPQAQRELNAKNANLN